MHKPHDAVVQAEFLKNLFGIGDERFELLVTLFRAREFEHFNFLELVLALQAARVFSGRAGFGAKAGRPRAELDGELIGVERFVAIEASELDLGCRRQPKVRAFEVKHVGCKFGQLAHAGESRGVYDERRENFGVAVCGVRVEKERGKGAFETRAEAAIDREPRAAHFRGALEIEDPGALGDFPMRARLEIKFWRSAPAAHFDVRRGGVSDGDGTVRAVGHGQHEVGELRVQFGDALVGQLDFLRNLFHFCQQGGDVFSGLFFARDFLAGLVALGL